MVESMLKACIPGGSSCDPQEIADAIRQWFNDHKFADSMSANPRELTDMDIARMRDAIRIMAMALRECERLSGWHTDDAADPAETSPEDAVAHINGLIRREVRSALASLDKA